jgi:hypothetical protein
MVQPCHEIISVGLRSDSLVQIRPFGLLHTKHDYQTLYRRIQPILILQLLSQNFFGDEVDNQDNSSVQLSLSPRLKGSRYLSRYTDGLRVRRPGFDSRERQMVSLCFMASRPALRPSQHPIQYVPEAISPEAKGAGA